MDNIKIKNFTRSFTVSNDFVDVYMKDAHPSFVKVYIYILRHSSSESDLSLEKVAEDTGLLKSDVVSAFKYWHKLGVVSYSASGIEILPLDGGASLDKTEPEAPLTQETPEKKILNQSTSVASAYKAADVVKTVTSNQNLSQLFAIIGQLLNKSLTPTDYKIIYSFVDYLKLPEQVIVQLFEYCIAIGKTNMRYIERVAYAWADNGINTPQLAESYVRQHTEENDTLKTYKKNFRISGRDFTESEEKMLLSWINELKASEELIMQAYDITVMNTGKISFKYMDAVIRGELENKGGHSEAKLDPNVRKSTFRNYPESDKIGDIEKKMIEKMMSSNGGGDDAINQ